ncbi:ABC transporter ATP-binding protein [Pseudogracilibacillus auburnensis]|uniref:ABC transporter ATP-binding protein n=1 Tax=Pseudogracilibacillus auburnensis TaxID=1494959 RepID=UPI001A96E47E|nr:ABC transporter ATP-binding protein [Pseudogracilibacillus auburnensis]MBO1004051.1 ABC transporter ATP-binding protein [Pseudogracilibacillus auburnensis]
MEAIQTKGISLKIDKFQLDNISLSIPSRKITSIVGPNGSGKSTLLKIISRLVTANDGTVYVQNKNAKNYKTKEFAKTIAMLPQSKDMLPNVTVRELISFGREPYKHFLSNRLNEEDEEIIDAAMKMTKTTKHENRLFYSLSGGEQQKVRIAMALAQKTDILLLDEPTTFLDIAHQYDLMELLQQINEKYNMTIIMVLHELQQAAAYSHYMIAMKHGNIIECGVPEKLLSTKFLHDVYEIDARILFEDGFPLIIPKTRRKQNDYCNEHN